MFIMGIPILITRFMGPTWGPSGADMTQVGPILAPWTLLSGHPNATMSFYWIEALDLTVSCEQTDVHNCREGSWREVFTSSHLFQQRDMNRGNDSRLIQSSCNEWSKSKEQTRSKPVDLSTLMMADMHRHWNGYFIGFSMRRGCTYGM